MLKKIINSDNLKYIKKWSLKDGVTYSDIEATEVYCPCDAVVIYTGRDREGYYSAVLQICADVVVQLSHLLKLDVVVSDSLLEGQTVGRAFKFCRISLATLSRDKSDETIRIYDRMYYKRNPEQLTEENLGFVKFAHGQTGYYVDSLVENIKFSKEQDSEYSQMEVQYVDE